MSGQPVRTAADDRALRGSVRVTMVTGEAVLIDIAPAPLPTRAIASVIDWMFTTALLALGLVLTFAVVLSDHTSAAVVTSARLVLVVGCWVGVPIAIETLTRGRSLGKWILGLRTVRDDGGPIVFRHALIRGLFGFVELYLMLAVPAVICAMSTAKGKRAGDLAAGTYVVRDRTSLKLAPPHSTPAALQQWARGADIATLPDGLALAMRQFVMRAPSLTEAARVSTGTDLMRRVQPLVAPPPPTGTHPEAYLAAVLGERRRRDAERLAAAQQLREKLIPPEQLG